MADSVVNGCLMVENWSSLGAAADDLVGHFGFLNNTDYISNYVIFYDS